MGDASFSKLQGVQGSVLSSTTGSPSLQALANRLKPPAAPDLGAPPPVPEMTDPAVLAARRAAARRISAAQGLQSTFLTTPQLGTGGMLGGGDS